MRNKKGILIALLFILLIGALVIVYFCFFSKEDNVIKDIFGVSEEITQDNSINDNYNGVYTLEENIGMTVSAFDGCTFSTINNYVLVTGDEYKVFRASCLGTFLKSSGSTESLDFVFNENTKLYDLNFNDEIYFKDLSVRNINVVDNVGEHLGRLRTDNYKFLLKELEFEKSGKYLTADMNSDFQLEFVSNESSITMKIITELGGTLYSYTANSIDSLPDLTSMYNDIVVLEKNHSMGKYVDRLLLISERETKYSLYNVFPILIDGTSIDSNYSIFIDYNPGDKKYSMYVGYDDKLCVDGGTSDSITYYEFLIEYDYAIRNFKNPYFVGFGREKDGCNTINSIIGG
ncbi:MAG: hypothetical protein IJ475_02025 [Bacilli bacterium]|nr:hypothetical protein [Bacilli bacterium]